ncbi:hypothetical protein N0V93_007449 [Gnomoniopsis smithogilvyi]|uniref:Uncharacterized protein n=1 Tax=Gnomoniopsis smithogilvyi TaxID=1191159 RepID=A0A9W9CWK1_9PEZI|nr:hypothetical protein N0V93_007449 [Gnomoniopsis smithogilvyi]
MEPAISCFCIIKIPSVAPVFLRRKALRPGTHVAEKGKFTEAVTDAVDDAEMFRRLLLMLIPEQRLSLAQILDAGSEDL